MKRYIGATLSTVVLLAVFGIGHYAKADTVYITGNITSNTTWDSSHLYVIRTGMTINSGATLTIDAGTIVKFDSDYSPEFYVDGTLDANGTSTGTVYFTSYKDDSVGGDTNGDGSATTPAAGNWIDIKVDSGGTANFDHSVIRYGGYNYMGYYSGANLYVNGGTLDVENSDLATSTTYGIKQASGTLTLSGSDVHGSGMTGVYVTGGSATVSSNTFHNLGAGVYSNGSTLTLTDNTFAAGNWAVSIGTAVSTFTHSGNTASGAAKNGITIYGTFSADRTWTGGDLPYIIEGDITVNSGVTLAIDAGAIVKIDPDALPRFYISGTLDANGTSTGTVYFTSYKDDSVGGDTNGDGSATTPAAGNWIDIKVDSGGTANFDHSVIRYGGYNYMGYYSGANLYVNGGTLTANSSDIGYATTEGIKQGSGGTNASYTTFHDSSQGIYATGGSVWLVGNTYSNSNGNYFGPSVYYQESGGGGGGTNGQTIVSGSVNADTTWTATTYVVTTTLTVASGKMLTILPGAVVKFRASDSLIVVVGGIRAIGSEGTGTIYFTSYKDDTVGGDSNGDGNATSATSADWGTIEFGNTSSSTISHAVVRYGGSSSGYSANLYNNYGTLNVDTTEVATSAGYGIRNDGGTLNISASYVHGQLAGIYVSGGTATVTDTAIRDNSFYGIENTSGMNVQATNNWWADDSGPTYSGNPSGIGEAITDNVTYNPWRHSQYWWGVRNSKLKWYYDGTNYWNDLDAATFNYNSATTGMGIIPVSSTSSSATSDASVLIHDDVTATSGGTGVAICARGQQCTITLFYNIIEDQAGQHGSSGWKWQRWAILHEMGHVLGLGHYTDAGSQNSEVMYNTDEGTVDFGDGEKEDYKFLWNTMLPFTPDPNWWHVSG